MRRTATPTRATPRYGRDCQQRSAASRPTCKPSRKPSAGFRQSTELNSPPLPAHRLRRNRDYLAAHLPAWSKIYLARQNKRGGSIGRAPQKQTGSAIARKPPQLPVGRLGSLHSCCQTEGMTAGGWAFRHLRILGSPPFSDIWKLRKARGGQLWKQDAHCSTLELKHRPARRLSKPDKRTLPDGWSEYSEAIFNHLFATRRLLKLPH